jgi:hypothetical protein
MNKTLITASALTLLWTAAACADTKPLPDFMQGIWCARSIPNLDGTYKRCNAGEHDLSGRDLVVRGHNYTLDITCKFKSITASPDETYSMRTTCMGADELISAHLSGDTLHWNTVSSKLRHDPFARCRDSSGININGDGPCGGMLSPYREGMRDYHAGLCSRARSYQDEPENSAAEWAKGYRDAMAHASQADARRHDAACFPGGREQDVRVKALPDFMLGMWCAYDDPDVDRTLFSDQENYKRCGANGRDLDVRKHDYLTDTLCKVRSITMAPDKTYSIRAACLGDASNTVISEETVSAHLAGDVLRWDVISSKLRNVRRP